VTDIERRVIAIDGPSSSGKSTVARGVANAFGLRVLDTGAMYRAVTLAVLQTGTPLDDEQSCASIARSAVIEVEDDITRLDGRDVSAAIRGPEVTAAVSTVSAYPAVRRALVEQQRLWVERHDGGVVEGRDIGTVVFPGAALKVFLVADDTERAQRRLRDEHAAAREVGIDAVQDALAKRDALDSGRSVSPLRSAEDAVVIDTTGRVPEDVVAEVVARYRSVR
jgi:CMP/dCMP kinase